jgi:hypothetical protein
VILDQRAQRDGVHAPHLSVTPARCDLNRRCSSARRGDIEDARH